MSRESAELIRSKVRDPDRLANTSNVVLACRSGPPRALWRNNLQGKIADKNIRYQQHPRHIYLLSLACGCVTRDLVPRNSPPLHGTCQVARILVFQYLPGPCMFQHPGKCPCCRLRSQKFQLEIADQERGDRTGREREQRPRAHDA